jgi:hypothetical protein
VQIAEGLQAGQRVVTTGVYGLPDNVKLNVETKETAEQNSKPVAGRESEKDGK